MYWSYFCGFLMISWLIVMPLHCYVSYKSYSTSGVGESKSSKKIPPIPRDIFLRFHSCFMENHYWINIKVGGIKSKKFWIENLVFQEKPKLKIISFQNYKHWYLIHTWSAFKGTVVNYPLPSSHWWTAGTCFYPSSTIICQLWAW